MRTPDHERTPPAARPDPVSFVGEEATLTARQPSDWLAAAGQRLAAVVGEEGPLAVVRLPVPDGGGDEQ